MNEDVLGSLTGHEARRRYVEEGVSSHELALAAGVSQGETKRRLVEWRVFRTYAGDKLSPQLLTRHLAAGMSDQEIADAVGITITTVQAHVAKLGNEQPTLDEANQWYGAEPVEPALGGSVIEHLLVDRCLDPRDAARELGIKMPRFEAAVRRHELSHLMTPKPGNVRLTEEQLVRYERGGSLEELAREVRLSGRAVGRCLAQHGVRLREDDATRSGARQPKVDRLWLIREYHERGRTLAAIASEIGVSEGRVSQLFAKYGIETGRRREEVSADVITFFAGKGLGPSAIAERLGVRANTVSEEMRRLGLRRPRAYEVSGLTRDLLEQLYVEQKKSMSRIAQELDVPLGQVKAAFDKFAIPRRSRTEAVSRGLGAVLTREYLEREYVQRARPVAAIAREVGTTSPTVEAYLVRTGLKQARDLDPRFDECLSEEALRALYVDEGRTITEVSAKTAAPPAEVRKRLRAHGIPIRSSARNTILAQLPTEAAVRSASEAPRDDRISDLLDEEFLREAYEVDGLGTRAIAELAECDADDVIRALVQAGISIRLGLGDVFSEPFLRRRYVEEEASASEIAREVGTSSSTVASWLDRHGIEVRPRALIDGRQRDKVLTREFLEEQCVRLDRSASEVARELGTRPNVVLDALRAHGLPVRPRKGGPGSALQYEGVLTRTFLESEYVEHGRSMRDIAASVGVTVFTVRRYLDSHGLAFRTNERQAG